MKLDGSGAESFGVNGAAAPWRVRISPGSSASRSPTATPSRSTASLRATAGENSTHSRKAPTSRLRDGTLRGDRVFAVTFDRRLLTLDPATGAVLQQETVPLQEGIAGESLLAAACSPDGTTQAYSISYTSSRLYLGRGMS